MNQASQKGMIPTAVREVERGSFFCCAKPVEESENKNTRVLCAAVRVPRSSKKDFQENHQTFLRNDNAILTVPGYQPAVPMERRCIKIRQLNGFQ